MLKSEEKAMKKDCNSLIQAFKTPHTDYGPLMMWFWNDTVTEERITWEMEKFRQQNITNFFAGTSQNRIV